MNEFTEFLELPSLLCSSFVKTQASIAQIVHDTAWEEMHKAGEEEKRIAIDCGDLDTDGIPVITVIADGQWSKRCYKTKYDALSGVVSYFNLYSICVSTIYIC